MEFLDSNEFEEQARALLLDGKPAEALDVFEKGLKRFPEDSGLELGRGMALIDLSRPKEAREVFQGLVQRHPGMGDAFQGLAEACLTLGLKEEAIAAVRKACGPEEQSAEFIHTLGHLLFRHELYDDAILCYRRAIELDRGHGHAWVGLAAALKQSGKRDEALTLLRDAVLDRLAGFWEAYSYLGCLLYDAGRTDEAQAILNKIPLDELGDPGAAQRLRSGLDIEAHPERALFLEQLEARIRARRADAPDPESAPADSTDDWKPHVPFPQRFWQGSPTLVTRTSAGQDLDQIFSKTFKTPCIFDGKDKPEFISKIDISLCEAVLGLLAEFLEAYPWREHQDGTPEDWWKESGAESLMSYVLAIIQNANRTLQGKAVKKSKPRRLLAALDKVWPTLTDPSRTHSILVLLWMAVGAMPIKKSPSRAKKKVTRSAESRAMALEFHWRTVSRFENLGHGVNFFHACIVADPVAFIHDFGWYHGATNRVNIDLLAPSAENAVRMLPETIAEAPDPESNGGPPRLTGENESLSFLAHERPTQWTRAMDEVRDAIEDSVRTRHITRRKGLVSTLING